MEPDVIARCYDKLRSEDWSVEIGRLPSFRIGRKPCDISFSGATIPEVVASVEKVGDAWELTPYASQFLEVNGVLLSANQKILLDNQVNLKIGQRYEIQMHFPKVLGEKHIQRVARLNDATTDFAEKTHSEILRQMRDDRAFVNARGENISDELLLNVEVGLEEIAKKYGLFDRESEELAFFMAGMSVQGQIQNMLLEGKGVGRSNSNVMSDLFDDQSKSYSRFLSAKIGLEKQLSDVARYIARKKLNIPEAPREDSSEYDDYLAKSLASVEENFWNEWFSMPEKAISGGVAFINYLASRYLKKTLKDVLFGYGPLEDLLQTPVVTEIMVVNYKTIYIEKQGRITLSGRRFFSEEITQDVINRIVTRVNRQIDKSRPLVDARLSDGSRVNAVIDPIAVDGACLTIRRFPQKRLSIKELVENPKIQALTPSASEFLKASILARKNILVSGGTGTGKTTLLNCLCDFIPDGERIVTIEDVVELRIAKRHVVRLESKAANSEGLGAYTIRDLVRNALRMRPDRIIVGECRGGEALDMLQAMNTGHDGSLTTIHANTAHDAALRLETLVLQSDAKMPIESIDRQIVSAIDLIVQLKRMRNGRRCVSQIVEVTDIDPETGEFVLRDIFKLTSDSDDMAVLQPTGSLPTYMNTLLARNWLDLEKFYF